MIRVVGLIVNVESFMHSFARKPPILFPFVSSANDLVIMDDFILIYMADSYHKMNTCIFCCSAYSRLLVLSFFLSYPVFYCSFFE